MKPCTRCGVVKPLSEYRQAKTCTDGHRSYCKICEGKDLAKWKSVRAEYGIWSGIKSRCYDTNHISYPQYGGRGIYVCREWLSDFAAFSRDMGPRPSKNHSIDRVDNNGPYSPDNCKWSTKKEQSNNRNNNVFVCIDGVTKTVSEWCCFLGKDPRVVNMRYRRYGWTLEDAVSVPIRSRRSASK